MKKSTLFAKLPDYVATPDGMAIDNEGTLILACPNYADQSMPGCVLKIDKDKNIKKWFDVPVHEETGLASPMGIAFGPDGTVTKLCQNGDTDGLNGELDQPGEPIIRNGKLIVSCFDLVSSDIVVNTAHELPATLADITL